MLKRTYLIIALLSFLLTNAYAVVISNVVLSGNQGYAGNYQLFAVWNDGTNVYQTINQITDPAVLSTINTMNNLVITNNTIQVGSVNCTNVNFNSSPIQLDSSKTAALNSINIQISQSTYVTAQGNNCAMGFIMGDNTYLLLLGHDDMPLIYVRAQASTNGNNSN